MRITENEALVLKAIVGSEFHDGSNPVGNPVWSFSANPWAETKASRRFAATLVSLMRKGLATQSGDGRDACVAITKDGFEIIGAVHIP